MVEITAEYLMIPYLIFTLVFLCMYVLLGTFAPSHRKSFSFGMMLGISFYSMIIYGVAVKDSGNLPEWITRFALLLYGATLYITIVILIAVAAIMQQFTTQKVNWISGVAIPLSIFEAYFSLTCVGNVPFMEKIISCT